MLVKNLLAGTNKVMIQLGKKLDRVLVDEAWISSFKHSYAFFETNCISDHTRSVIHFENAQPRKKNRIQF